jgi:hypothetical protein
MFGSAFCRIGSGLGNEHARYRNRKAIHNTSSEHRRCMQGANQTKNLLQGVREKLNPSMFLCGMYLLNVQVHSTRTHVSVKPPPAVRRA